MAGGRRAGDQARRRTQAPDQPDQHGRLPGRGRPGPHARPSLQPCRRRGPDARAVGPCIRCRHRDRRRRASRHTRAFELPSSIASDSRPPQGSVSLSISCWSPSGLPPRPNARARRQGLPCRSRRTRARPRRSPGRPRQSQEPPLRPGYRFRPLVSRSENPGWRAAASTSSRSRASCPTRRRSSSSTPGRRTTRGSRSTCRRVQTTARGRRSPGRIRRSMPDTSP